MILVKISSNKDINLLIPHTNLSIYIVKINQSISEKGLIIDNSYENRKGHPRILPKTFTQTTVPALIYHRRTIPFRFPPVSPVSGTLRNSETLFLGILSDAWDGSLAGPSTWFPDTVKTKQRRVSSILNGPRDYYFKIYEGTCGRKFLKKRKKREKGEKKKLQRFLSSSFNVHFFSISPYPVFRSFPQAQVDGRVFKMTLRNEIWWFLPFFYCFFPFFLFFFTFSNDLKREHLSSTLCKMMKPQFAEKRYDLTAILFVSQCPLGLIHRGKFCVLGASPGRVLKKICLHLVVEAFCFDYFLVAFNHISRSEYLFRDEVLEWKLFLAGYALFLKVIVSESLSCKIISNVLIKVFSFWTWRAI